MKKMIKKTADGVEIVKGMKVWICPSFDIDDGDNIDKLKTWMDEFIVSSVVSHISSWVYLKREKFKMRWSGFLEDIYADKKNALKKRIEILQKIISAKRDSLNKEVEKVNKEIDEMQDLKNDLDNDCL